MRIFPCADRGARAGSYPATSRMKLRWTHPARQGSGIDGARRDRPRDAAIARAVNHAQPGAAIGTDVDAVAAEEFLQHPVLRTRSVPHSEEVVSVRIQPMDDAFRRARIVIRIAAHQDGLGMRDRHCERHPGSGGYAR